MWLENKADKASLSNGQTSKAHAALSYSRVRGSHAVERLTAQGYLTITLRFFTVSLTAGTLPRVYVT